MKFVILNRLFTPGFYRKIKSNSCALNTPLHWDMEKSKDELDALTRHLIDHSIDPLDEDGQLHLAKVAWRALAGLERFLTNKH